MGDDKVLSLEEFKKRKEEEEKDEFEEHKGVDIIDWSFDEGDFCLHSGDKPIFFEFESKKGIMHALQMTRLDALQLAHLLLDMAISRDPDLPEDFDEEEGA